jgi:hypothetical protein
VVSHEIPPINSFPWSESISPKASSPLSLSLSLSLSRLYAIPAPRERNRDLAALAPTSKLCIRALRFSTPQREFQTLMHRLQASYPTRARRRLPSDVRSAWGRTEIERTRSRALSIQTFHPTPPLLSISFFSFSFPFLFFSISFSLCFRFLFFHFSFHVFLKIKIKYVKKFTVSSLQKKIFFSKISNKSVNSKKSPFLQ